MKYILRKQNNCYLCKEGSPYKFYVYDGKPHEYIFDSIEIISTSTYRYNERCFKLRAMINEVRHDFLIFKSNDFEILKFDTYDDAVNYFLMKDIIE